MFKVAKHMDLESRDQRSIPVSGDYFVVFFHASQLRKKERPVGR
jgi:hypothetical protein